MIELSVGNLLIANATIRNTETNGIFRMKDWEIERIIFDELGRTCRRLDLRRNHHAA